LDLIFGKIASGVGKGGAAGGLRKAFYGAGGFWRCSMRGRAIFCDTSGREV
jgi:hypothetical protein